MARQNRVTPFGTLISTSARGAFMGNRGVLHDRQGKLTAKRWTHPHWIICDLIFKDSEKNPRPLMTPGCYTELFFLDEATALAAGHRPCAECRRADFNRFKQAWLKGNAHLGLGEKAKIGEIDRVLQKERVAEGGSKATHEAILDGLPDGTMIVLPGQDDAAALIWNGKLYRWAPEGYSECPMVDREAVVRVLTPASTVNALRAGFRPQVALK